MQNSNQSRRTLFTTDAKLAIRRKPAATMATAAPGQPPAEPVSEPKVTLEGYPIVWNQLSDDRGGFCVRLLPGSAKFVDRVHALFHHNYESILGATDNSTLRLTTDEIGVKVEIDLPATTCAADVAELVDDGYVKGMSFSMLFDPAPESCTKNENGVEIMEVSSFYCDEVTVTAIPSFTTTTVAVQASDANTNPTESQETQSPSDYARIEQTHKLDRLRLELLEI